LILIKETEKPRFVIGYDLNDQMSQISYFEVNRNVPETLIADTEDEKLGIPTVLCKRKDVSQWHFGNEAERIIAKGEGTRVGKLLSFARSGAKIELEGEAYDCVDLLILFVRRTLNLLALLTSPDQVEALIFTVDTLEGKTIEVLDRIASALPVERDRIYFQTYEESSYYYILHQPKDIWEHEVMIFDYSGAYLRAYELWMNKRTTPVVAFVEKNDYQDILTPSLMLGDGDDAGKAEELDEKVVRCAHKLCAGKAISTVFLIGDEFEGAWCDKTIKFLCMGKRVFQGKNLYSKGACYCAKDKLMPSALNKDYVFLGKDKLKFNLGINLNKNGEEAYFALADAGDNWYDTGVRMDCILEEGKEITFVITPLDGKGVEEIKMELTGLPIRPNRATRLRITIKFETETKIKIDVKDLGFGEMYPTTGRNWEKILEIV